MTTAVVCEIPTPQFALHETFDAIPNLSLDAEPAVDHADSVVMPLLWMRGAPAKTVTKALKGDSSVISVARLIESDGKQLYRIRWNDVIDSMLRSLLREGASLLNVSADKQSWRFRLVYPERAAIELGGGNGTSVDIHRVGDLQPESTIRYGLTDKQHEALQRGWLQGYFDVPRRIGIEELSSDLGITHQATSERLRRGQSRLIKEAFGLHGRG